MMHTLKTKTFLKGLSSKRAQNIALLTLAGVVGFASQDAMASLDIKAGNDMVKDVGQLVTGKGAKLGISIATLAGLVSAGIKKSISMALIVVSIAMAGLMVLEKIAPSSTFT